VQRIAAQRRGLCLKNTELQRQSWQQNLVFILKTLFTQQQSEENFKNPTSIHDTAAVAKLLITENNAIRLKKMV
jgi:hypothetical protein